MCGIVGFIGQDKSKETLIEGLKRLEYRGYDSAGIALLDRSNFLIKKTIGRVGQLEIESSELLDTKIGIAHTRWATHGGVTVKNAHPHTSKSGRFTIVHNGVVDNYKSLIGDYLKDIQLGSETDTEVIVELIDLFSKETVIENAISLTLKSLEGSYALVILDNENPEQIIIAKNKSPLILGKNHQSIMVASDVLALAGFVDKIHVLDDETFFIVNKRATQGFNLNLDKIQPSFEAFDVDPVAATRGDFPHYMLKEIHEQPTVIERLLLDAKTKPKDQKLIQLFKDITSIEIIAAGTSYHAGLMGKRFFEESLSIQTNVHVASEFAYYTPTLSEKPLFMFISQSGETADLIACLPIIKNSKRNLITITNVLTSRLAKEANITLDVMAGPEIAVASTKAFTAQVAKIALLIDEIKGTHESYDALTSIQAEMSLFLSHHDKIKTLVSEHLIKHHAFYIGRGLDYYLALEASLKLKEISYIQSEAFPAGELKHGTIALIEDKTPVIAILSEKKTSSLTRANIEEVKARGANSLVITIDSLAEKDDDIILKDVHPLLNSLLCCIPTQLIAYYAALIRGHDIDKPRNLAKSVTVE
jgi:glutamine---fructose-6-phosphate transaminase (isomerizing)